MKLAIVIPYFKFSFFEETVASLANQTNKNFKLYIGNDASPECPEALLEKYKGKFDFTYKKFESNLGTNSLVQQWDRCIEMIEDEEWIMILGDDDVLHNNVVEEFYSTINEVIFFKINVIRFASIKINSKSEVFTDPYLHPKLENSTDFFFRNTRSSLSEYIFRKECVDSIGFKDFPLAWYSDVLGVLEFSVFEQVYSINTAMVNVRISEHSISGKKDNLLAKSKSKSLFYGYLTGLKLHFFNKEQKIKLLQQFGNSYLNDKKNVQLFLEVSKSFISNMFFKDYLKFLFKLFYVFYNIYYVKLKSILD